MAKMLKALWGEKLVFTGPYPVVGSQVAGQANFVVDLVKQGIKDTVDRLSVQVTGTITTGAGALGTATGAENPQGLLVSANLTSAPLAAGLVPVNQVSSRGLVVDEAVVQRAFDNLTPITNVASSTIAIDMWVHMRFKRPNVKKGIDYAHPMYPWSSDVLTLTFGTVDQLFTGAATTWNFGGVQVNVWADLDIDANPDQIHATEIFEQQFNITATNPNFMINNLPQGCFYDNLYIIAEDNGALSDDFLNNISIQGAGRFWTNQGEQNADFIRQVYTKPHFYDPAGGSHGLTGLWVLPLRDGLWSRALDATSTPVIVTLDVTGPGSGHVFNIRIVGRKLVPGGIKKTVRGANGTKSVTGLPVAS
jgi:hypothetical protein